MRILSIAEHAAWLAASDLAARPYVEGGGTFRFYLQFHAPTTFRATECFTEGILEYAATEGEVLLTVVNVVMPYDYEERLFDKIRRASNAPIPTDDSGGHLFTADERRDSIPVFSLTAGWQWEVYLHMPHSRTVLLNWEGAIFDLWTDDESVLSGVFEMLERFGLTETEGSKSKRARRNGGGV